jgi:signal transduction histidine kinase
MRLGVKGMLLILTGYAVLILAFALVIDRWLHSFEETVTLETSRLLAREQAALLSERSFAALQTRDSGLRVLLRQRLEDMTLLSEVVSSITVVDREGRIVASDRSPPGGRAVKPEELFAGGRDPVVRTGQGGFLRGGDYSVAVPLVESGRLLGYVDVELKSERVSGLFGQARRQFLIAAVSGLAGVVLLGGALQFQISRRAASIARTLEEAIQGPPEPPARPHEDEFARALRAAGRVRRALSDARRETSRLQQSFNALAQAMKMGVVLLRGRDEPDFANARALELLGSASTAELKARWPEVRPALEPVLAGLAEGPGPTAPVQLELPGAGVAKLRVEAYRLGGAGDEYLILLNDPDILDALETDVRLASQLDGLARVYRTVAHELRAPLSAMMIHLDLLRESLSSDAPEQHQEAQQRYVVVLREELERLNRSLSAVLTQTLPATEQRDRFDLRDALGELSALLAAQARRQGVALRTRLPETPTVMVGYRDRLKQSFLNVAVNALEAMPQGGRMGLEMDVDDTFAIVRVSDTGRGIPAELLARIYEKDFTTKGGGSGIGLYVARALIEMHGGEIRVESEAGRGTLVEMSLPIVPRD